MAAYELKVTISDEDTKNLKTVSGLMGMPEPQALGWSLAVAAYVADVIRSDRTLLVRGADGRMTQPSFDISRPMLK